MYVRRKRHHRGDGSTRLYFQLVTCRRVDGRPRQRVLAHLGQCPSVEAALAQLDQRIATAAAAFAQHQAEIAAALAAGWSRERPDAWHRLWASANATRLQLHALQRQRARLLAAQVACSA